MRKKLLRVLASLAIVASVAVVVPTAATAESYSSSGNCVDGTVYRYLGMDNSSPSVNRYGVRATIQVPGNEFTNCVTQGTNWGSASAWVSLSPRDPDGDFFDILQIGLIRCASLLSVPACDVTDQPADMHYFYAAAGCLSYFPFPSDLGQAPEAYSSFEFKIEYNSSTSKYDLWGYPTGTTPSGPLVSVPRTYSGISCWIGTWQDGKPDDASWFGERVDNGDGLGAEGACVDPSCSNPAYRIRFRDAAYKTTGSWTSPGWAPTGQSCKINYNYNDNGSIDGICDLTASSHMDIWTYATQYVP